MNKSSKSKKTGAKISGAKIKDLSPRKNPKGGLPAVQKIREASRTSGQSGL